MDQVIVTAKMIREARERREAEAAQGAFNLSRARPLKELMAENRARKEAAAAAAAASAAPAPVAAPAPAPVAAPAAPAIVPRSEIVPDYIKNIKVGDTITYGQPSGYMGDGGDSRDVGYTLTRKVLKLLGNYTYEVETQYQGNKPEIFKLDNTGEWLRDTRNNRLTVYRINDTERPDEMSDAAFARQEAIKNKKRDDKSAKFQADYTKGTRTDLVRMIERFMSAQGKRLSNLKTAPKDKLLELIQKYNVVPQ
jgi:hypothetical protein